jgi:hypothetical protein
MYIRRAAGKALIRIGDKSGFPVLFNTLADRSVDNLCSRTPGSIPAFLMEFSGVNFGFDVDAWKQWWSVAESSLDLPRNKSARKKYGDLIKRINRLKAGQTVNILKTLQLEFPEYSGFDQYLAEPLYRKSRSLVTSHPESIQTAVKLLEFVVKMDTKSPEYPLFLMELLVSSGKIHDAEEVFNTLQKNHFSNDCIDKGRKILAGNANGRR